MDRDIERVIRGMFAVYRIIKRLRKTKDVRGFPSVTPLFVSKGRRPVEMDPMDVAVAKERERGYGTWR